MRSTRLIRAANVRWQKGQDGIMTAELVAGGDADGSGVGNAAIGGCFRMEELLDEGLLHTAVARNVLSRYLQSGTAQDIFPISFHTSGRKGNYIVPFNKKRQLQVTRLLPPNIQCKQRRHCEWSGYPTHLRDHSLPNGTIIRENLDVEVGTILEYLVVFESDIDKIEFGVGENVSTTPPPTSSLDVYFYPQNSSRPELSNIVLISGYMKTTPMSVQLKYVNDRNETFNFSPEQNDLNPFNGVSVSGMTPLRPLWWAILVELLYALFACKQEEIV
ncbi:hypothetical protein SprV_0802523100 [Sparganum proliferum]